MIIISPDDMEGMRTLNLDHEQVRALYKRGYDGAAAIKDFAAAAGGGER